MFVTFSSSAGKGYDWKDSNMALFGSDAEEKVKKDAGALEPAWENAGKEIGLQIWRIVKFEVKDWDKEQYGEFYSGDSYIILNTYKPEGKEQVKYDLHFWIGKYSTQDEYGRSDSVIYIVWAELNYCMSIPGATPSLFLTLLTF